MKEREIDLLDMVADMLSHWRSLLVAAMVGAVFLGGGSYVKSYQASESNATQEIDKSIQNIATEQEKLDWLEQEMPATQTAEVLAMLDDEKQYAQRKVYCQNSIYMQLNPLQIAQTELVYQIQMEDGDQNSWMGTVYEALIDNVGLYDWVAEQTGIKEESVQELISVDAQSGMTIKAGTQELSLGNDCIKVVIMQQDQESCQKITDAVKKYIIKKHEEMVEKYGKHEFSLISESTGTVINKSVMETQISNRNAVDSLRNLIASTKTGFTKEQKEYYNLLRQEDNSEDIEKEEDEKNNLTTAVGSKKYIVLGAALFLFAYGLVLCGAYIFDTKLRVNDELHILYDIPQFGIVVKDSKKKCFLDKWIDNLRYYGKRKFTAEQSMELAFAAVKIAVTKNGLDSICLMGCNLEAGANKVCEDLQAALEKEGIKVIILNNVLYDAEAMERVDAVKGVILIEKAGSTLYNEITNELELLKRQDIPVLGEITVV